ncbi:lipopolysaccharide biosynthesis protein [Cupriavidus sp. CuC1]|uniref:lipopolysaccharide biosynthesis protein n=1 Tax=Cupriavidus sp. CuC1 TaxID=3373131 RepID=UPI0037CDBCE5
MNNAAFSLIKRAIAGRALVSLMSNAAIYSVSNILNGLLPFLLLPILTRALSPQEYGVIAMFNTLLGILAAFTGLSVQGAVNSRYASRDNVDFSNYVGASLWVLGVSTSVTAALVALVAPELSKWIAVSPFWLLSAVAVSCASFVSQIRLGVWLMERKPIQYGVFQVSLSGVNCLLSLTLVLWVERSAEGRLWGQSLSTLLYGALALVSLMRGGWIDMRLNTNYMREIFRYGIPLVPHALGGFLLALADRFVANERLGLQAAGVYMVAAQLGMAMAMIADAFNKAFVPWLFENLTASGPRQKQLIVRGTWGYFICALIVAGGIAACAPQIILICAGPAYGDAAGALGWIALGQAFGGMYLMVTNYIFFTRKTMRLGVYTLAAGAIGVGSSWWLAPSMGVAGIGVGFALGMAAKFLLTWRLAQRVYPMPWFPWCKKSRTVGVNDA